MTPATVAMDALENLEGQEIEQLKQLQVSCNLASYWFLNFQSQDVYSDFFCEKIILEGNFAIYPRICF